MRRKPADRSILRTASRFRPGPVGSLILLAALAPWASADIFHLTSGGRLEGELLEQDAQQYKIRTVVGTVTLTADAVERVEPAPSPFQEYERRRAQAADAAEDQFALARWCEEQGLVRERLTHLRRALALNLDYEPARKALGYVRVGDLWIDGRTVVEHEAAEPGASGNGQPPDDPQKLAASIQGTWYRRIYAIRTSLLESSLERQVQSGRERIASIKDPLAIVPLVQVLSEGTVLCRRIMVDALARFPEDAATVNLTAVALADPDRDVRRTAITELVRRKDSRVSGHFRKALESGDDVLIRRAAEALGALHATEAVPELIDVLKARQQKMVEVPVRRYFVGLDESCGPTVMRIGSTMVPVRPMVALANPAAWVELQRRRMDVTVFRTEALEALREITGEDFGFEPAEWARWYEEYKS